VPDAKVGSVLLYQQAQKAQHARRKASDDLSGKHRRAAGRAGNRETIAEAGCAAVARSAARSEWQQERALLAGLTAEVQRGLTTRAAKLSSRDAALTSRTQGRR